MKRICIILTTAIVSLNVFSQTISDGIFEYKQISTTELFDDFGITKDEQSVELVKMAGNTSAEAKISVPSKVVVDGKKYSVISIGSSAFLKNEVVESVSLDNGILRICDGAFAYCYNLKEISLPKSLKIVESYAFTACVSLKSIAIPERITVLEGHTFEFCKRLESVEFPKNLSSIGDFCFRGCYNLNNVVIPQNVKVIGNSTFKNCKTLSDINLSKSCETIEPYAFSCCVSLEELVIPSKVKRVSESAFDRCAILKSIVVDPKNQSRSEIETAYQKSKQLFEQQKQGDVIPSLSIGFGTPTGETLDLSKPKSIYYDPEEAWMEDL